jgi:protein O-mannosyl-transferase
MNDGSPGSIKPRWVLLTGVAILAAVVLTFSGVLGSQFTGWDDELYVYRNPQIRSLAPASIIHLFARPWFGSYTPLALVSHAVDFALFGGDPWGHHLVSLLMHAVNSVWVFFLGLVILAALRTGGKAGFSSGVVFGAAAAALLYGVHPLRVESVASVADRKDLLCLLFGAPSVIAFTLSLRADDRSTQRLSAVTATILMALALFSKSVAAMLPFVLLILWMLLRDDRGERWTGWRAAALYGPMVAIAAVGGAIAVLVAPSGWENDVVAQLSGLERRLLPFYNMAFYVGKTVWPSDLAILYAYSSPSYGVMVAAGMLAVAAAILLSVRGHWRLVAPWGAYLLLLLPTIGILPSAIQPTADRYSYLATVPLFLALGAGLSQLWESVATGENSLRYRMSIVAGIALVAVALGIGSAGQIRFWADGASLWRHVQAVTPGSPHPDYNLGLIMQERAEPDSAIDYYIRALKIKPDYPEAFVNLGNIHRQRGDTLRAVSSYRKAIELQPSYALARENLAGLLLAWGKTEEAIAEYRAALDINPRSAGTLYGLSMAYRARRDRVAERETLERLVAVDPENASGQFLLGITCIEMGDAAAGVESLRRAARLGQPDAQQILTGRGEDW